MKKKTKIIWEQRCRNCGKLCVCVPTSPISPCCNAPVDLNRLENKIDHLNSQEEKRPDFNESGLPLCKKCDEYACQCLTPKERWKPKEGEEYYFVDNDGRIEVVEWGEDVEGDNDRYSFGNIFCTTKKAEEAKEKVKELLNKL